MSNKRPTSDTKKHRNAAVPGSNRSGSNRASADRASADRAKTERGGDRKRGLEQRLQQLIGPVVDAAGLELVLLRVTSGSGRAVRLQLQVDRKPGEGAVGLEECAMISRKVGATLDVEDPIAESYELEVSSPGMNRILRHEADFRRFSGMTAKITLESPDFRKESLVGVIADVADGAVTLTLPKGQTRTVQLAEVRQATLQPTIDEWTALGRKLAEEAKNRPPLPFAGEADEGEAEPDDSEPDDDDLDDSDEDDSDLDDSDEDDSDLDDDDQDEDDLNDDAGDGPDDEASKTGE